jgi:DUF3068 family protein
VSRLTGLILAGAGAFLIVLAIVAPVYITSQVIEFPLNEYETVTLTATGASYFSPVKLTEITGADLRATYTIKGDAAAGGGSIAVWDEFAYIYDTTSNLPVQPMSRVLAFNRRTAQLVQCCGESVNGKPVLQAGLAGIVFPIGTRKQTYQVYDTTLDRPVPFAYTGTVKVDGVPAYEFTGDTGPQDIGYTPLSATEPEFYSMRLEYWADPETGAVLKISEHEDEYLSRQGKPAVTVLDADLTTTPATVASLVRLDRGGRAKVRLLDVVLPLVLAGAGIVSLGAGVLLARKPGQKASPAAAEPASDAA